MKATKRLKEEVKAFLHQDGYCQTILNIMYKYWEVQNSMNYKEIVNYFEKEYGKLAKFTILIEKFNEQVCNGGHYQYIENGFTTGEEDIKPNISLHKELIELFEESTLDDDISKEVLTILKSLKIELDEELYIEEEIINEDGEVEIEEYENLDYMSITNKVYLAELDYKYYKYSDEFMAIIERYLEKEIK